MNWQTIKEIPMTNTFILPFIQPVFIESSSMIATALASRHIAVNKNTKRKGRELNIIYLIGKNLQRCGISSAGEDTEKWACREAWEYKVHKIFEVFGKTNIIM